MSTINAEPAAVKRKQPRKIDELLARWSPVMDLIDSAVRVEWASHSFTVTVRSVAKARLIDLVNAPEPRVTLDGKKYTPTVISIVTDEGALQFVDEDVVDIITLLRGVIIRLKTYEVVLKRKV